jgi:hypothetical protein
MLYLIGVPGAGKTTLMRMLVAPLARAQVPEPIAHTALYAGPRGGRPAGAELGIRREKFSGTDSLAMDAQPKVLEFLEQVPYPIVLAEGDRLANGKFFLAVMALGYDLHVVHVDCPPDLAAARRAARGSEQDARWVQGRVTKVARLAAAYASVVSDAVQAPGIQVARLRSLPGVGALLGDLYGGRFRDDADNRATG